VPQKIVTKVGSKFKTFGKHWSNA